MIFRNLFKRRPATWFVIPVQPRATACAHIRWFSLPVVLILPFATGLPLAGQSDSTTYLFDHSLDAEEAGVVALTAIDRLGQNAFVSSNVFGITQTVYRFDGNPPGVEQAGLQIDTTDLLSSNSEYSVETVFRFTEGAGPSWRVFDARNRQSDFGLYVDDFRGVLRLTLPFDSEALGPTIWTEIAFHHVVLTVSAGEVNAYLDGSHEFTETTDVFDITSDNLLTFFADNYPVFENGEVADGEVALIRLYDRSLTIGDVEKLAKGQLDADGDGINYDEDAFVLDPTEWKDTDGDGIGNNADGDDDNDGIPDENDSSPLFAKVGGGKPPEQDHYLFVSRKACYWCEGLFRATGHDIAWAETSGDLVASDTLTVEAWVLWEGNDLEEFQEATGIDTDRMSLFCGQRAYGFQRRLYGAEGWTFFLQTDEEVVRHSGLIPLPSGEWSHLAATYDGTVIRTFLNGAQQSETPASGTIPNLGDAFPDACTYSPEEGVPSGVFGLGLGNGFEGGIRQLRIWNRALTRSEIVAHAEHHLLGTESGLVGYWPFDGPSDATEAPNRVPGGPPLRFGDPHEPSLAMPAWYMTNPLFLIREDLAEDAFVPDCPSLDWLASWSLVDVQDDGDLDLIFAGSSGGAMCSRSSALLGHDTGG